MSKLVGLRRQAVVADLIKRLAEAGSWCGETHVQKSMYLLDSLGVPTDYKFVLYRHGPYSFDLHDDLVGMTATGILGVESRFPYGPSLEATRRAENVLRRFPKTTGKYAKQLDFVAKALAKGDMISLERLATAFYVTKRLGTLEGVERRARELNKLKPHVSLEQARLAVEHTDQLIEEIRRTGLEITADW
ncbi:MAG: hypothetical protein HYY01_13460 [Chloroflexi bacterium]|nr:hypothetical protein [Chloroflexota bacterium]